MASFKMSVVYNGGSLPRCRERNRNVDSLTYVSPQGRKKAEGLYIDLSLIAGIKERFFSPCQFHFKQEKKHDKYGRFNWRRLYISLPKEKHSYSVMLRGRFK